MGAGAVTITVLPGGGAGAVRVLVPVVLVPVPVVPVAVAIDRYSSRQTHRLGLIKVCHASRMRYPIEGRILLVKS